MPVAVHFHVGDGERRARGLFRQLGDELEQENEIDEDVVVSLEEVLRRSTVPKRPFEERENTMRDQRVLLRQFDLDDVVKELVLHANVMAEFLVEVEKEEVFDIDRRVDAEILARRPRATNGIARLVIVGFRDDDDHQIDRLVDTGVGIVDGVLVEISALKTTRPSWRRTAGRRNRSGKQDKDRLL